MANTLGTSQLGNFIPEIWANTALEELRGKIVLAKLITKDTDITNAFTKGDVLTIPVPGTFTANDKAAGTAITLQNPSADKVQVTLDKHKEVSFVIEDVAAAQTNQETMRKNVGAAAKALAEAIENDCSALYTNFTVLGGAGTAASRSSLFAIRQSLNDSLVDDAGRFVIVGSAGEVDLLEDTNLQTYFANARPEAIAEGSLGRVAGLDIYMSQLVPASGTGATSIAGTPEFGVLAMRSLPMGQAPGVEQLVMRDPKSGLMLRQTASYDHDLLGIKVTLDVLYGVGTLRTDCGRAFAHAKS